MDNFPKFLTWFQEEDTGQFWFLCRKCEHQGKLYFNELNMRRDARDHARTCPAKGIRNVTRQAHGGQA